MNSPLFFYNNLGFKFSHPVKPKHIYQFSGKRIFNTNPTIELYSEEDEKMLEDGYDRIWNCGYTAFIKEY